MPGQGEPQRRRSFPATKQTRDRLYPRPRQIAAVIDEAASADATSRTEIELGVVRAARASQVRRPGGLPGADRLPEGARRQSGRRRDRLGAERAGASVRPGGAPGSGRPRRRTAGSRGAAARPSARIDRRRGRLTDWRRGGDRWSGCSRSGDGWRAGSERADAMRAGGAGKRSDRGRCSGRARRLRSRATMSASLILQDAQVVRPLAEGERWYVAQTHRQARIRRRLAARGAALPHLPPLCDQDGAPRAADARGQGGGFSRLHVRRHRHATRPLALGQRHVRRLAPGQRAATARRRPFPTASSRRCSAISTSRAPAASTAISRRPDRARRRGAAGGGDRQAGPARRARPRAGAFGNPRRAGPRHAGESRPSRPLEVGPPAGDPGSRSRGETPFHPNCGSVPNRGGSEKGAEGSAGLPISSGGCGRSGAPRRARSPARRSEPRCSSG